MKVRVWTKRKDAPNTMGFFFVVEIEMSPSFYSIVAEINKSIDGREDLETVRKMAANEFVKRYLLSDAVNLMSIDSLD